MSSGRRPPGSVTVTWRYPHKVVRRVFGAAGVEPATVVGSRDSEGDPYFYARVVSTDGETIDLAESHDRSACERACKKFNAALGRPAAI